MATDPLTPEPGDKGTRARGARRPDPFAELWAEAASDEGKGSSATTTEAPAVRAEPSPRRVPEPTPSTGDNGRRRSPPSRRRGGDDEAETVDASTASASGPVGRRRTQRVPIRARQVQRIIRRVDPWSVLKTAVLFYLSVWFIVLLAGTILWLGAASTGMIDNVETFISELGGWEVFEFEAGQLLRGVGLGGLLVVIFGSVFTALLSVIFNLIADLTGGIRVNVVEVERARRPGGDETGERSRPT